MRFKQDNESRRQMAGNGSGRHDWHDLPAAILESNHGVQHVPRSVWLWYRLLNTFSAPELSGPAFRKGSPSRVIFDDPGRSSARRDPEAQRKAEAWG